MKFVFSWCVSFLYCPPFALVALAWDCDFFPEYMQNERYAKKCLMLGLLANAFAFADAALIVCYEKRRLCHPLARYSIRYRTVFHIKLTADYFLTNVKCFIFVFSAFVALFSSTFLHVVLKLCPFQFVASALWKPISFSQPLHMISLLRWFRLLCRVTTHMYFIEYVLMLQQWQWK